MYKFYIAIVCHKRSTGLFVCCAFPYVSVVCFISVSIKGDKVVKVELSNMQGKIRWFMQSNMQKQIIY